MISGRIAVRNMRWLVSIGLALAFLLVLTSVTAFSQPNAQDEATEIKRTPWQIHRGLDRNGDGVGNDVIRVSTRLTATNDPAGFALMEIPAINDVGWTLPTVDDNGNVSISEESQAALRGMGCLNGVDFTYFQTLVSVPAEAELTDFEITFGQVDDLARIYLFNKNYPDGQSVGGDVAGNGVTTQDLSGLVAKGETNRVVIVQYDDCPVRNNIKNIQINVNGAVAVEVPTAEIPVPGDLERTNINVCSQFDSENDSNNYWNLHGTNATSLREKLTNPANFGPEGRYGTYIFSFKTVTDTVTTQGLVDAGCDIFFSGFETNDAYDETERVELKSWVDNNNGQVIAGCDNDTHDPVCEILGYEVATGEDSFGFLSDRIVNPINCDASLTSGDRINMSGGAGGHFVYNSVVNAADVLADYEVNGEPDPTKPVIIYTGDYFLTSDINMIQTGSPDRANGRGGETLTDGPDVTNVNDRMAMNAFSALADAATDKEVCSSAVANIQGRIYVDKDATGAATGLSWTEAFTNVQDALAVAVDGDEVWVAEGVYYPDVGGDKSDNDRHATFTPASGVALYGGFNGTELTLAQRDWIQYKTVLSGDIDGNDTVDANGVLATSSGIAGENSYHVLQFLINSTGRIRNASTIPVTETTVIDGFVISGGNADHPSGSLVSYGGGLLCFAEGADTQCSPSLTNLVFTGNSANSGGGAISFHGNSEGASKPTLRNITFARNSVTGNYEPIGLAGGGAIRNSSYRGMTKPLLFNVIFAGNTVLGSDRAKGVGGAIQNISNGGEVDLALTNVTFSDNEAQDSGGAVFSTIRASEASTNTATLTNVILWGNTAPEGPSIYGDNGATVMLDHSVVENGQTGITVAGEYTYGDNNSEENPLFVSDTDLRLEGGSSAINLGLNSALPAGMTTDLAGADRITGDTVDAGAYEFQGSTVSGQVVNATNDQGLTEAQVCISGTEQCAETDGEGQYTLENVSAVEQVLEVSASGYITVEETIAPEPGQSLTKNFALSPNLAEGEIRIILTWGESPTDLDSHLFVPAQEDGQQRYNIYYPESDRGSEDAYPFAKLDVDNTAGYGPETITIKKRVSGKYTYAVNQFSDAGSFFTSEAEVRVFGATGIITTFTPPTDQEGRWWYVFDLDGDTGDITPIQKLQGEKYAVPQACGLTAATADYGPISVGTRIILGEHTQAPDGETNWNPDGMDPFIGQETVVTNLAGVDDSGCPVVRVEIDEGDYAWRVRDVTVID